FLAYRFRQMNFVVTAVCALIFFAVHAQSAKESTHKGRELYERREYIEALLNPNTAIESDKNYAQANYVRGNIKDAFDDRHGAMKDYNLAIEKNPRFAEAFFARGNVKMKLQDYYGAISDFSAAISINENYIEAYF